MPRHESKNDGPDGNTWCRMTQLTLLVCIIILVVFYGYEPCIVVFLGEHIVGVGFRSSFDDYHL